MPFRKNKKYNMDMQAANETLQNVFAACEQEPNERPLEVIWVWNVASAAVVKAGFRISIVLLVLVLLMPVAFIKSSGEDSSNKKVAEAVITNHYMDKEDGCFVIVLEGDGINYEEIYAKRDSGVIVYPKSIDRDLGEVRIPFVEGNLNIYIQKSDGTFIQAVLSK